MSSSVSDSEGRDESLCSEVGSMITSTLNPSTSSTGSICTTVVTLSDPLSPPCPLPLTSVMHDFEFSVKCEQGQTVFLPKNGKKLEPVLRSNAQSIVSAGRPRWYDTLGRPNECIIIGLCGGSASGKTTVANKIIESLNVPWVKMLSMDSFYKALNEDEHEQANNNEYNFDHPDAIDFDLYVKTLRKLKEGKCVEVPNYNFSTHSRGELTTTIYGANVIICDGILLFTSQELLKMMDLKVFIDTASDICLARRVIRDTEERGREPDGVFAQYDKFVKPMFDKFIQPSMKNAHIIVPLGANQGVIDLIVQYVHTKLMTKGFEIGPKSGKIFGDQPLPNSLQTLSITKICGMQTSLSSKDISQDEFVSLSKQLMQSLIKYAISVLPSKMPNMEVVPSVNNSEKTFSCDKVCVVSIFSAGETEEQALCEVPENVCIGKIVIQKNSASNEPELHCLRLQKNIKNHKVILMNATMTSGATAMMDIRILLDFEVPEKNIILCSPFMAVPGIHFIANAFPKVQMITTKMNSKIND